MKTKMKTKVIPLSETKELKSDDLIYLRRHAKLVFKNLELKINKGQSRIINNCPPHPHQQQQQQQQQQSAWFDNNNNNAAFNFNSDDNCGNDEDNNKEGKGKGKEIEDDDDDDDDDQQNRLRFFNSYGFCIEHKFCNTDEINQLKNAMSKSVQQNWFPDNDENENENDNEGKSGKTTFGTDAKSNEARGDPFLESSNKVSYFVEPTAIDSLTGKLKSEFVVDNDNDNDNDNGGGGDSKDKNSTNIINKKLLALCKAGHGLHLPKISSGSDSNDDKEKKNEIEEEEHNNNNNIHEPFFQYSTSTKLRQLVLSLGYIDPVIPQSMYIFKNPIVGGAVNTHQDSTFLYTTPKQTCLGLWLALDDATLMNGCLWIRPKSHLEPVRRQFIRNPLLYNNNSKNGNSENVKDDEKNDSDVSPPSPPSPSKLVFRNHHKDPNVTWEGKLPDSVEVVVDDEVDNDNDNDNDNDAGQVDDDDVVDISSSSLNFVPVEVKAGDLVVFCGTLDHFSLPNFSNKQRQ
jgi:phytanoyl-CoA hydroxylase